MSASFLLPWSIAVHGGAGAITRDHLRPEQDVAYRQALIRALEAGTQVLAGAGSCPDALRRIRTPAQDAPKTPF
ncbi:MAG: hypothetical protein CGW95_06180 [Phenylobacterium zucineum]|nr:MAG: hypothetical protein CGW95_06180 [Phenylobacterium zucineum]